MRAKIRKLATIVDETHVEMGRAVSPPTLPRLKPKSATAMRRMPIAPWRR